MLFAIPEEVQSFNLDVVWIIIAVGFLCYLIWMIYMAITA